jgi:hypothetical protein
MTTMPDPNGLDVHDIQIAHVPSFDKDGKTLHNTVVTFHVGQHGPFVHTYQGAQPAADKVNADIDKQVQSVRSIVVRP